MLSALGQTMLYLLSLLGQMMLFLLNTLGQTILYLRKSLGSEATCDPYVNPALNCWKVFFMWYDVYLGFDPASSFLSPVIVSVCTSVSPSLSLQ